MRRRASSAAVTMRARDALSSSCACALAMAVATRSAKSPTRASVSAGSGSAREVLTVAAPHIRPATMIGAPTAERIPNSRIRAAVGPAALSWLSIRAGPPVRTTFATMFSPSSEKRWPTKLRRQPGLVSDSDEGGRPVRLQAAQTRIGCTPRQPANSSTTAENTSGGQLRAPPGSQPVAARPVARRARAVRLARAGARSHHGQRRRARPDPPPRSTPAKPPSRPCRPRFSKYRARRGAGSSSSTFSTRS